MTDPNVHPGASVPVAAVPNLRDLGGWPTGGGRTVRYGQIYRSTALDRVDPANPGALADLNLATVYDLRTESERTARPDQAPPGIAVVVVDVLADATDLAPAALVNVLSDPTAAEQMLGGGKALDLFAGAYRDLINLPSARSGYQRLFTGLATAGERPALYHCTTGKDRTGWATAALLMLLGVSDDDVMRDYLLTNDQLLPALQPLIDRFAAAGGNPDLLRPVLGVDQAYLETSLAEMRSRYGSVEAYFERGLGIDEATRTALQSAMIQPGAYENNSRGEAPS